MRDILKLISPENLFVADEEYAKGQAVVEMSEEKNMLYTTAQSFNTPDPKEFDYPSDIMMSLIYDVKNKTIEMRGRVRYHKSGNKTAFSSKPAKYSEEEFETLKAKIEETFVQMKNIFTPIDERTTIEFEIGEPEESIIKKMNDSGRYNIAISAQKK